MSACSSKSTPPPATGDGAVVVGIQGEQVYSILSSVHVTTKVAGHVTSDDTLDVSSAPGQLPKEIKLVARRAIRARRSRCTSRGRGRGT